jgi:hypothetical protein
MLQRKIDPSAGLDHGASFRRSGRFDTVEVAKILHIGKDSLGIPHVRFSLKITAPRTTFEEQRTLSLESFRRLYSEPVPAA